MLAPPPDPIERVLVTGASGVVGRALVDELRSSGRYQVVTVSRAQADLRDPDAARRCLDAVKPAVVFHLAAKVAGLGGNLGVPGEMIYENLLINGSVIEAARAAGVRKIVAAGSTAIYSDRVALPMKEEDLWAGEPHASEAAYGHAKRTMLAQLEAYRAQYGIDYAFSISTNVYGPHDRFDEAHGHVTPTLISKFHRAAHTGEPVVVWGDGAARRDFLFSKDLARAMRIVAERWTGPINLASGQVVSIRELVEALRALSGHTGDVFWDSTRPNGQLSRAYDVDKLRGLGFKPAYSLAAGLKETYDWYSRNSDVARR